jgi:hypothetical protein
MKHLKEKRKLKEMKKGGCESKSDFIHQIK